MGQVSWVGRYEHGLKLSVNLWASQTRNSYAKLFLVIVLTLRSFLQIYILTVLCIRGSQSVCYLLCIINLCTTILIARPILVENDRNM